MPSDQNAIDAINWELDSSTKSSVHLYTKYVPVDVTLTTAGTAQNIITIGTTAGAGDANPTVNLATNPSFETANPPTGYTATGSAIAQSAVQFRTGLNSIQVTPNNAAAGEGFYWTTPSQASSLDKPRFITVSAYFRSAAGSANTCRIEIRSADGVTTHATGNAVALAANWTDPAQRSVARFQLTGTGVAYRIYFVTATQFATVFS